MEKISENPIKVEGKTISLKKYYSEFLDKLEEILRDVDAKKNALECVDLTRAAVAVLSGHGDYQKVLEIIKFYNNHLDILIDGIKPKLCADFSAIDYPGGDIEGYKKKLEGFLPKMLVPLKKERKYDNLFEVPITAMGDENVPVRVYLTKDKDAYLIAAEEVNPENACLEEVVDESQKLVRIPREILDSI